MKTVDVVCIIDDDPIFIYAIQKIMKSSNFGNSFLIYENGDEGINNLRPILKSKKNIPDVILLDLNMPILDGWQFLEEFIEIPTSKKITIYIVSSSVDPRDLLRAQSYQQAEDYILKPISRDHVELMINNSQKTA